MHFSIVGTDVSDEVWQAIQAGNTYTATDIVINGENYFACYVPLRNTDNSIVGIVFAGQPSRDVTEFITGKTRNIAIVGCVVLVLAALSGFWMAKNIARCLGDASAATMQELSDSNDRTTEAIARIAGQIRLTDSSIQKISEAASLITLLRRRQRPPCRN